MNYKIVKIEKNNDNSDRFKYNEFNNALGDLANPNFFRQGLIASIIILIIMISTNVLGNLNVVANLIFSLMMSCSLGFTTAFTFSILDYLVIRKNYWKGIDNFYHNQELPKDIPHNLERTLCKRLNIAKDKLNEKAEDYRKFFQYLFLKEKIIRECLLQEQKIIRYNLVNAIIYNVYIDGELLTISNSNELINEGDTVITKVKEKNNLKKEILDIESKILFPDLEEYNIQELRVKKRELLEIKKVEYEEKKRELMERYKEISSILVSNGALLIKVKSTKQNEPV